MIQAIDRKLLARNEGLSEMSNCLSIDQLNAYFDGELDGETTEKVADHLHTCSICSAEIAAFAEVSQLFASGPMASAGGQISQIELARLHQNLDRSINSRVSEQASEREFLRTAGMLSSLAASILIISGVWLAEFPSRRTAALSPGVAVAPALDLSQVPDWERTALTLRVEPLPVTALPGEQIPGNQSGFADASGGSVDAQMADWMVSGLESSNLGGSHVVGGGVNHANP